MNTSNGSEKIKILLLENIHSVAAQVLASEGFEVTTESAALSEDELAEAIAPYHVLGIRSKTRVTPKVLARASNLLTVGAFCIGTDQVDSLAAKLAGVAVFNSPYSNTRSVAEMVLAEMICLSRQLGDRSAAAHQGKWIKSAEGSREVRGKTLGIVGYGHIGSQLSILAEALGLKVVFYDVSKKLPLGNSKQLDSLEDVLRVADFVSLHVPDTVLTKNMIRAQQLAQMKKGSCLINASRGSVVAIDDFVSALKEKHLAGAAVDVFPKEPASAKEVFESPLRGLANVILTPHIGGSTEEAQESIGREVSDSFIRFLKNGSTSGSINFPKVELPIHENCHRILNVHKNVRGVMKEINKIVSDTGANILAQYLSTDAEVGYLVMDTENQDSKTMCGKISALETSIRTRILF